jgi:DNA-binding MarR family transcriptional regulator
LLSSSAVPAADTSLDELYEALAQLARGRRAGLLHERLTELAGASIDPPGRLLLRRVADEGEVRLGELAAVIGLDPSTVSRKAQQLERAGLLARTADRTDKRAAMLSLTAEGKRLLRRFDVARRRLLGEVLADWTADDRRTLATLLKRLADDFARQGQAGAVGQVDARAAASGSRRTAATSTQRSRRR